MGRRRERVSMGKNCSDDSCHDQTKGTRGIQEADWQSWVGIGLELAAPGGVTWGKSAPSASAPASIY